MTDEDEMVWALALYDSAHDDPKYYAIWHVDEHGNRHEPPPASEVAHEDDP